MRINKTSACKALCLLVLVAVAAMLAVTGCAPNEREAIASGGAEKRVAEGTLAIDHVNYVPSGDTYRVAAHIRNNSDTYCCFGGTYTATIFDSSSVVLGNDTAMFPTIYPNADIWFVSSSMRFGERLPDRADLRVMSLEWRKVSQADVPTFTLVQANLIDTGDSDSKITGIIRYGGKWNNMRIGLTGVLLSKTGNPVDATTTLLENLPQGDYPYEMSILRGGAQSAPFRRLVVTAFALPR